MNPVATARLLSLRIGKCSSGSTSPAFRETFRSSSSDSSKSNVAACMRIIRGMNNSSSSSGSYSCCCFSGSTFSRRLFHSVAYEGPPRASATAASTAIPERAHRLAAADTAADPRMPARGWLLLCCGASLLIGGLGSCLWLLIDSPEPLNIAWEAVRYVYGLNVRGLEVAASNSRPRFVVGFWRVGRPLCGAQGLGFRV